MSTADLAIIALTGLNLMQGGCFYYRDKQLIGKLADRVQLPKAPAPPVPSAPDKASQDKTAPAGEPRVSALGGGLSSEAEAA